MTANRQECCLKNKAQPDRKKIESHRPKHSAAQLNNGVYNRCEKADCRNDENYSIHSVAQRKSCVRPWQYMLGFARSEGANPRAMNDLILPSVRLIQNKSPKLTGRLVFRCRQILLQIDDYLPRPFGISLPNLDLKTLRPRDGIFSIRVSNIARGTHVAAHLF